MNIRKHTQTLSARHPSHSKGRAIGFWEATEDLEWECMATITKTRKLFTLPGSLVTGPVDVYEHG